MFRLNQRLLNVKEKPEQFTTYIPLYPPVSLNSLQGQLVKGTTQTHCSEVPSWGTGLCPHGSMFPVLCISTDLKFHSFMFPLTLTLAPQFVLFGSASVI